MVHRKDLTPKKQRKGCTVYPEASAHGHASGEPAGHKTIACGTCPIEAIWLPRKSESWFRSSLSYPNVSFTQRTVLCTDVTLHDDLVALCAQVTHAHE